MKLTKAIVSTLLLTSTTALAQGTSVRGGGDPDAIEFVQLMKELPSVIGLLPAFKGRVTAESFAEIAKRFDESLNDANPANDRVVFSDQPITIDGIEKAGIFDGTRAIVHRPSWASYRMQGLRGHQRAIVLLEGLLALGIDTDRYQTAEGVLALTGESLLTQSRLMKIAESNKVEEKRCDKFVSFPKDPKSDASTYTVHIGFGWRAAQHAFMLGYLASGDELSSRLNLVLMTSGTSEPRPELGGTVLQIKEASIKRSAKGTDFQTQAYSSLHIDLHDGATEVWTLKNGTKDQLLAKLKRTGVGNFRKDESLSFSEVRYDDSVVTSSCSTRAASADWKSILLHDELAKPVAEFDAYITRVTNTELAYETCRAEGRECTELKRGLDQLAKDTERRWSLLTTALKSVYEKKYKKTSAAKPSGKATGRLHEVSESLRASGSGWSHPDYGCDQGGCGRYASDEDRRKWNKERAIERFNKEMERQRQQSLEDYCRQRESAGERLDFCRS